MGKKSQAKSPAEKAAKVVNTARNKVRRIKAALKTAGEEAVAVLQARLKHWEGKL